MRERLGVVVICAAHFLIGVDGLAVAIALPALQRDLGAAPVDGQWVLSAYGLAFGGALLLGGRLGDLYGRRRALAGGLGAFAAAGVAAGLAPTLGVLVAARVAMGLGAAVAVPAALALIGSLFPAGPERVRALSVLAAMTSVGTMSGLLLGGVVTDALGWRWVFLAAAPLSAAAAVAAARLLPEARAGDRRLRLDVLGALLVTAALVTLLFAVTHVQRSGPLSLGALAVGAALLVAFVAHERRARSPLVRREILTVRSLRAASLGGAANSVAFTAIVYVATLYLQLRLHYSPVAAGVALTPLNVVALVVPLAGARWIGGRPPRPLLLGCFAATALALGWLARAPAPADYAADVLGPLLVLGVSLPVAFVVLTQEAVREVDADDRGLASGIFETANHLGGGAVGVAVYAAVLTAAGYGGAFLAAAALTAIGGGLSGALSAPAAAPARGR